MLVVAELAKEKLARELEEMATAVTNVGKHKEHVFAYKVAADLIRNTDLTDCQPTMRTECCGDKEELGKCVGCPLPSDKDPWDDIAAPDQGSVRNATDDVQHCCGLTGFNPMLGDTCPRCDLNAAIRALPDQKD